MGWDDIGNGKLLALAAGEFDVLITVDQNMMRQQNVGELPLPVVVIVSGDIRLEALEVFVPEVLSLLERGLSARVYAVPEAADEAGGA